MEPAPVTTLRLLLLPALAALALPAAAQQQSKGYKFLEAVRGAKGDEVVKTLDEPGQTIVNTRDVTTGEGALHIVVKRGDSTYLRYLLQRGADPNLRDGRGDTPLLLAVQYGQGGLVDVLTAAKANPNLANGSGETPLIRAVQKRDLGLVRQLLAAGANPDQTDNVAGMSARDYAKADGRAPAIAKLLDETPKRATRAVAGPKF
ncbi:ankyrin repeat domain-containing protein [Sphingomonas sp. TZW2008]|uniref:ankyrin repeat domain-containing protein n=1 Tax=Sphingomonas sp. TZW2008 TaxID=1917973 RepID=UPI000A26ECDB